jgi:hypothetical protein
MFVHFILTAVVFAPYLHNAPNADLLKRTLIGVNGVDSVLIETWLIEQHTKSRCGSDAAESALHGVPPLRVRWPILKNFAST